MNHQEEISKLLEAGNIQGALPLMEEEAKAGHVRSSEMLSQIYMFGQGVRQDSEKGRFYLKLAAEQGSLPSMENLYHVLSQGVFGPPDWPKALKWLEKASAGGHISSTMRLANHYFTGDEITQNLDKAKELADRVAQERGTYHVEARKLSRDISMIQIGNHYYKAQDQQLAQKLFQDGLQLYRNNDFEGALAAFRKSAEKGSTSAMTLLSGDQRLGELMEFQERFDLANKGATLGSATAMYNLAHLYLAQDLAKKEEASFQWMKTAAEGGLMPAAFETAKKYYNGQGTEKNLEEAIYWAKVAATYESPVQETSSILYRKLVEELEIRSKDNAEELLAQRDEAEELFRQGLADSQKGDLAKAAEKLKASAKLGNLDAQEVLITQGHRDGQLEDKEAFQMAEQAATKGSKIAVFKLAQLYEMGKGTPASLDASFQLMNQAARSGLGAAYYPLAFKNYMAQGTPRNLDEAERWATEAVKIADENQQRSAHLLRTIVNERLVRTTLDPYVDADALALEYEQGNESYSQGKFKKALSIFEKGARLGYGPSLCRIGLMYLAGEGLRGNREVAFDFLQEAALRGDLFAAHAIADHYMGDEISAAWLAFAKVEGFPGAEIKWQEHMEKCQEQFGSLETPEELLKKIVEIQKTVPQDKEGATPYYDEIKILAKKAALQGNPDAFYILGDLEEFGRTKKSKANRKLSSSFYKMAALLGHSAAMKHVGDYYRGRNDEAAGYTYEVAAQMGHSKAKEIHNRIKEKAEKMRERNQSKSVDNEE